MDHDSPPRIATGDQPEWNGSTPDAWRALAQNDFSQLPSIAQFSPDQMKSGDVERHFHLPYFEITCRCAATSLQILAFRLGWRFLGLGLKNVRDETSPDTAITLVRHMLGRYEIHLAQFANDYDYVAFLNGHPDVNEIAQERNIFLDGGSDPLHLSRHCTGPIDDGREEAQPGVLHLVGSDSATGTPRAILEIGQYANWYGELGRLGEFVGRANGSVDIYCKPVGWLGTYRLSPRTSVWHATTEEVHLLGFPREYFSTESEVWPIR